MMTEYKKYKDSGIPWIGQIAEHWSVERLKNRIHKSFAGIWGDDAQNNDKDVRCYRVADFDYNQLSISDDNPTKRNIEKSVFEQRKVLFNDILLEKSGGGEKSPVGRAVYVNLQEEAVCSNFVHCIRVNENSVSKFMVYIFSDMYSRKVNLLYFNQTTGIQNLNISDYLNNTVGFPPIEEQQQIADFLDVKCAEVDELIALQEKMIDELKVYKQSVITEAVTKGLNPDAPLKDSGIEWIGQIPEHWSVERLKNRIELNPSVNPTKIDSDTIVSFMPMECLRNAVITSKTASYSDVRTYTPFQEQDIVMAKVTPCYENGNIAIATNLDNGFGFGTSEIFVIRCNLRINNNYLFYYLQSSYAKNAGIASMTGTGGLKRVNPTALSCSRLLCPPIDEQQQIADYLDTKCVEIDEMTSIKQQKIEQLKEYKKSIIYEYVTGKKQVNIE